MNGWTLRSIFLFLVGCTIVWPGRPCSANPVDEDQKSAPEISSDDLNFFEQRIRPALVKHCYSCHSDEAAKAGRLKGALRVDSRQGLLRGGDSGAAIVPKQADESLLLKALRYESLQMPPDGKLPANLIADFERWIDRGAADPRREAASSAAVRKIDLDAGRQHWSYRPLPRSTNPDVRATDCSANSPVDAFVDRTIVARGLKARVPADRSTLVRRLFFDLVGLPPEPEEIDEFLIETRPDAVERLVDRLLASPQFGVRWGRHWLSVARFGESLTLRGLVLPNAWRYRDYVVQAFNSGMPFDRFIVEQIAGDLLPAENLADRQRQMIATTFLALGNLNLEEQDKQQLRMDVVDEQLEAIGKGFLAQTIGCARCHDHKFDPIPTRDYYAIAGILANVKTLEDANVSKWLEFPLPLEPAEEAVHVEQERVVADLQAQIKTVQDAQQKLKALSIVSSKNLPGIVVDDRQATIVGDWERSQSVKPYIDEGYLHDKESGKGSKTVTLLPELPAAGRYEVRLAYTPEGNRSAAVPVTIMSADGEKIVTVNQKLRPPIDGLFVSLGQFRFEMNGQGYVVVSTTDTTGVVVVDAVQFLPLDQTGTESSASAPVVGPETKKTIREESARLAGELQALQKELQQLQSNAPHRPKYMSVHEEPTTGDVRVHLRGTVHNLGEVAPRGFLQVATTGDAALPKTTESGRKELGQWIASRSNPLTPRVFVNRLWNWLFGAGISRTVDNFGTTGETPSNPELLDHLANRLLERDWSIKPLIREIVTSDVYQRSSFETPEQRTIDPENRFLSHANRRRLDAECLLDSILTVSRQRIDELDGTLLEQRIVDDYGYVHRSNRRAVYWPVLRNSLPEIFEAFDFADPSVPSGSRSVSTVAPQSLFFLNSGWVHSQAQFAAQRIPMETSWGRPVQLDRVFQRTLGRMPSDRERQLAESAFIADRSDEEAWTMVIQALFASIDFRYVE